MGSHFLHFTRDHGRSKPTGFTDSQLAVYESSKRLEEIQNRGLEVSTVAEGLKHLRVENHFAEKLRKAMHRVR